MPETKQLLPIAKEVAKLLRKYHLDYDQTKHVFKVTRKELGLKPPKSRGNSTVKRLNQEDLRKFLEISYKRSAYIGLLMETLYETGARVDEFVNLQPNDLYTGELRIIIKHGKGDKRREVPITQYMSNTLRVHLQGRTEGYLFETNRHTRFTTRRIQQLVREIAQEAEIAQNVTPHTLRHTRATLLAEKGMSKDVLQLFLGHDKPETTQIYTRTAALDMQEAFRQAVREG